jgi:hypothetical protein
VVSYASFTRHHLCQELCDTLTRSLRSKLDCHLTTILQEARINNAKPSPAEYSMEVVCYLLQLPVGETTVV